MSGFPEDWDLGINIKTGKLEHIRFDLSDSPDSTRRLVMPKEWTDGHGAWVLPIPEGPYRVVSEGSTSQRLERIEGEAADEIERLTARCVQLEAALRRLHLRWESKVDNTDSAAIIHLQHNDDLEGVDHGD